MTCRELRDKAEATVDAIAEYVAASDGEDDARWDTAWNDMVARGAELRGAIVTFDAAQQL